MRLALAYVVSLLTLLLAIFISHSILENIITTQRTLTRVNTLVRDTQVALTDSIGVTNDHRTETKKDKPNQRLLQLISRRTNAPIEELTAQHLELKGATTDLQTTPVWEETRWILEDKPGSMNDKLGDYIHQIEVSTAQSAGTDTPLLTQIPIEAAGARYGAMFVGYQKASDLLEEKLNENSTRIERVHRALTALMVVVILLISVLVVAPLWRRVVKEHLRLQEAHQNLHKIAYTDKATGLPNLDGLHTQLGQFFSSAHTPHLYLLLVRFKNLDELYKLIGSHKVDELLQTVSRRLSQWDNQQLNWCRSGDAEFSTLISADRFASADKWIQPLHHSLSKKFTMVGIIVRPEVSMAASKISKAETVKSNVLWEHQSNARLASVNFQPPMCWLPEYEQGMQNKLASQYDLINKISDGIKKLEFVPYYQPKVCAKTGEICSLEVLARWVAHDGTIIPPGEFIPAAESSGLIVKLTYSLFDQVLADVQQWCNSGLSVGRVAINVAADVLQHSELLQRLDKMNEALPQLCEGLEVEITENIALGDDITHTKIILQHIRSLGIHVAIDDFGTGYASLQTLIDMPVDVLKIDRSFVLPMTETGEGKEVVSAMISLSNALNKICVVEGIETEWQWSQLAELGADELQGFFFHRPANKEKTTDVLLKSANWGMTG